MNMNFKLPTEIVSGRDCVKKNAEKFRLGKKAFIVCGRSSAKTCGALDDVTAVLESLGIGYEVYNRIVENPPVALCFEGGAAAAAAGADFVIGIGGGSPLDAAKAVAAFAANPGLEPMDIYSDRVKDVLPIIAVPTTSGTGSEVDPVAVMTLESGRVKKSFKTPDTFPKYAFLDAKYTETVSLTYTVSTALDALCHCVESYLSPKSTLLSRMFASEGAKLVYDSLSEIERLGDFTDLSLISELREKLLYGATLGGLAIGTTGTGFNHPLGYNLTLYHGVPHGSACAAFMEEYFGFNSRHPEGAALIGELCRALGDTPETVAKSCVRWAKVRLSFTADEIDEYIANVKGAKNYANSPYVINETEMREIYTRLFNNM